MLRKSGFKVSLLSLTLIAWGTCNCLWNVWGSGWMDEPAQLLKEEGSLNSKTHFIQYPSDSCSPYEDTYRKKHVNNRQHIILQKLSILPAFLKLFLFTIYWKSFHGSTLEATFFFLFSFFQDAGQHTKTTLLLMATDYPFGYAWVTVYLNNPVFNKK